MAVFWHHACLNLETSFKLCRPSIYNYYPSIHTYIFLPLIQFIASFITICVILTVSFIFYLLLIFLFLAFINNLRMIAALSPHKRRSWVQIHWPAGVCVEFVSCSYSLSQSKDMHVSLAGHSK